MIRHMRHGSPPRLMALQSILSPNRRESPPTPSAGVRITLEIERLKLEIARLRRERFGPSAERSARLEQLELSLEDLEEAAAEVEAAQAADAGETTEVRAF